MKFPPSVFTFQLPSFNISSGTSMMSRYDKHRGDTDLCNNQVSYLARIEVPNVGIAQQVIMIYQFYCIRIFSLEINTSFF